MTKTNHNIYNFVINFHFLISRDRILEKVALILTEFSGSILTQILRFFAFLHKFLYVT